MTYQFSARGHELGQLLIAQLLDRPFDAASVYYRSRPFMLGSGLTLAEALAADMARAGGFSEGRDVGVVFNMPRRGRALVLPTVSYTHLDVYKRQLLIAALNSAGVETAKLSARTPLGLKMPTASSSKKTKAIRTMN